MSCNNALSLASFLLFRVLLWNIVTRKQYPDCEFTNAFMISLRFSKLRKLDNRPKQSIKLLTGFITDSKAQFIIDYDTKQIFLFTILYSFSPNIFFVIGRKQNMTAFAFIAFL